VKLSIGFESGLYRRDTAVGYETGFVKLFGEVNGERSSGNVWKSP
jgi:hypothetical protein